jgi:tetratricopeptide (TPR) repeat protein
MDGVSAYKQEFDAARVLVKPRLLRDAVESFTIDFGSFKDEGATLSLLWENTAIDLQISMDIDSKIEAAIRATLLESKNEPKAGDYHNAAVYYMGKDKNLDQALVWMNKSVEMSTDAFWYVHRKAELLGKMGKKDEAIQTAEKSLAMAKANADGDFGYVKRNEELIAKLKK